MPFLKHGNYFAGAKTMLGNAYARSKQWMLTADRHVRGALKYAAAAAPIAKQIADVAAPQYKGAVSRIHSGVQSGAKEYERMRQQVGSVAQAAEKLGGNPIGTNNFY